MPHHRIVILITKKLYIIAGLCLVVFSTPATAVFESYLSEIPEALTIRCETGVRFTDEHGLGSKLTDDTKAKLYFHLLRTEIPITSKRYLGPFATYHDVFQKDVYLFFIPETNT